MTANQLQLAPIPASIDNPEAWEAIAQQVASESGLPTAVTPDLITGMLGSAVPLRFEADATDANLLRGTFTDQVIAQCQSHLGSLRGGRPTSVVAHLIGVHMADGHPTLRAHLSIQVTGAEDNHSVTREFWDLRVGSQATVGQPNCPNCGAPIANGHLICEYCGTDARTVVNAPLVVSRLELY